MTAVRVGLSSTRLCLIAAVLLAATACTSTTPVALSTPTPSPQVSPAASPSPSPAPSPLPNVACLNETVGTNTVMLGRGGEFGEIAMYDVTDPVHPLLLCRVLHTSANLSKGSFQYLDPRSATETNIVTRWIFDGNQAPAGKLPGWITNAAWLPEGAVGAFTVRLASSANCPAGAVQVWTYTQGTSELLTTYCIGIGDCICRFGLPAPVLAFSPDGKYLVEGWLTVKGSQPMGVYRVADRVRMASLPVDTYNAFWDRSADRLFVIGQGSVQVWNPDGSIAALPGAASWSFYANLSPDGTDVAYTAYSDKAQMTQPRVYAFNLASGKTRMLSDQPRSQVVFVKDSWVWYFEEQACADCPNGTKSTGKVFAMNVSTGVEQQVTFRMDETVINELLPGEFWPNS